MSAIQVREVDERDSSWEDPRPHFRVYLHGSSAEDTRGSTATYDITGADVVQVIDWAQRQTMETMTYAIALVLSDRARPDGDQRGLVWLVGMDGNDGPMDGLELAAQERMLGRRDEPVGVPEADRMPGDVPDADITWFRR